MCCSSSGCTNEMNMSMWFFSRHIVVAHPSKLLSNHLTVRHPIGLLPNMPQVAIIIRKHHLESAHWALDQKRVRLLHHLQGFLLTPTCALLRMLVKVVTSQRLLMLAALQRPRQSHLSQSASTTSAGRLKLLSRRNGENVVHGGELVTSHGCSIEISSNACSKSSCLSKSQ